MSFDVLRFLRENHIPFSEKGNNVQEGWVGVRCPFCGDSSNHGGFNLLRGYYNCWRCGWHSVTDYIQVMLGVSFSEAKEIFEDYTVSNSVRQTLNRTNVVNATTVDLPGGELTEYHRQYLIRRGFDPDFLVQKYHIQGTGPVGFYRLRIIIPIIYRGRVVSFTSRSITDRQYPRYLTCKIEQSVMNPKHVLYNIDNCVSEWVGVVEGVFDCWRMGDNYCATLGTTMTEQQLRLLLSYQTVVFLFDSEEEAQARARKYAAMLSALGVKKTIVFDSELQKDPGEFSEERALYVRREILRLVGV
jgi:DNA primase